MQKFTAKLSIKDKELKLTPDKRWIAKYGGAPVRLELTDPAVSCDDINVLVIKTPHCYKIQHERTTINIRPHKGKWTLHENSV